MQQEFTQIKKKLLEEKFNRLNPIQQQVAFTVNGPILILAGAGSGKTTTITNRISYLVKYGDSYHTEYLPKNLTPELLARLKNMDPAQPDFFAEQLLCYNPVEPWHVLAITFTNKAANEMKERIEALVGDRARQMWISTFHSACVKILRKDIGALGYETSFAIYDSADSKTLLKDCMAELRIDEKTISHKVFQSLISSFKDKYISPEEAAKLQGNYIEEQAVRVYRLYQSKLRQYNALDFDDIIYHTVELFRSNPEILKKWQDRFSYIIVDEYQDTSKIQYMLISLLSEQHKNICVVGDDDQSIYKFRGADIENILSFEHQFPNAKVIKLEQNYRSTKTILQAANGVIANNKKRKNKSLWTGNDQGDSIQVLSPYNEKEEAQRVGELIEDYVKKGYSYSDIAILYRMNAQSRAIEENFLRNGIPHRVVGGTRFFDRKEIKDIVAYMRLAYNTRDDLSLKRIINEPKRGVGKTAVERLETLALKENVSIFEILERVEAFPELMRYYKEFKNFVQMIRDFQQEAHDIEGFVNSVIFGSGYMDMLNADQSIESRTRAENVKELISMVKDYKATGEENNLQGFLENVALLSDIDNYDQGEDAVVLMSMHGAKGLEFNIVFLVGLEEGIFPSNRSMASIEELEEERRLLYVAITRAKQKLYITVTAQRMLFGTTNYSRQSRFMAEIPKETVAFESTEKIDLPEERSSYSIQKEARRILMESKSAAPQSAFVFDIEPGERVRHAKFGEGVLLEAEKLGSDYKLTIDFDTAGTKKLMATFAKLVKIT